LHATVNIYKVIMLILFISRGSEITYLSNAVVAIKHKREHYMVIYSIFVDLLTRKEKKRTIIMITGELRPVLSLC